MSFPFVNPDGINDDLVPSGELYPFTNLKMTQRCVLFKRDAINKTHAKTAVTLVECLANRYCSTDSGNSGQFLGMRDGQHPRIVTAEADCARSAHHDFGGNVGIPAAMLVQHAV